MALANDYTAMSGLLTSGEIPGAPKHAMLVEETPRCFQMCTE